MNCCQRLARILKGQGRGSVFSSLNFCWQVLLYLIWR